MNVEIGKEAAQFHLLEHLNRILFAVRQRRNTKLSLSDSVCVTAGENCMEPGCLGGRVTVSL
jgi:hypothetical protein